MQQQDSRRKQPVPFADNGPFLANLVDMLAGGDALLGFCADGTTARPFTLVERCRKRPRRGSAYDEADAAGPPDDSAGEAAGPAARERDGSRAKLARRHPVQRDGTVKRTRKILTTRASFGPFNTSTLLRIFPC